METFATLITLILQFIAWLKVSVWLLVNIYQHGSTFNNLTANSTDEIFTITAENSTTKGHVH